MSAAITLRQDATTISLVGLAHALSHFMQMLLVPLFPLLMHEFDLNFSQIGFLVSTLYTISSLGQASSGFLVDRLGAWPVLCTSLILFMVAAILAANATSYGALMGVMVLVGLGNSPFHPVDFTIMNQKVSSARLGYAFSVHGVTGNLGWALAPVFLVGITQMISWRMAYYSAAALVGCVLMVLVWNRRFLQTSVTPAAHANVSAVSAHSFFKLPAVWWCFGFFMFSTMTLAVVQSYAISILQKLHSVSLYAASATLTAYMLCAALGMVVGGWVAAKFEAKSEHIVARAMACGAAALLLAASGVAGAIGSCVLLASTGFAVGVGGPSRDLMIKKATPAGATGRVYGLVYSGMDVGFAIAPFMFGFLMDGGHYASVLVGASATLMVSVALALRVGTHSSNKNAT